MSINTCSLDPFYKVSSLHKLDHDFLDIQGHYRVVSKFSIRTQFKYGHIFCKLAAIDTERYYDYHIGMDKILYGRISGIFTRADIRTQFEPDIQ